MWAPHLLIGISILGVQSAQAGTVQAPPPHLHYEIRIDPNDKPLDLKDRLAIACDLSRLMKQDLQQQKTPDALLAIYAGDLSGVACEVKKSK